MRNAITLLLSVAVLAVLPGLAQTPQRGTLERPNEVDPGVLAATLFENADVWVSHVRVRPGSARRTHQHDDSMYDVVIATDQGLKLDFGGDTKELRPWEAVRLAPGTPHSFQNIGTATVTLLELHMKKRQTP